MLRNLELICLISFVILQLRFGKVNKDISNTNVFEHSGKLYSVAENYIPQEINIFTLQNLGNWDVNGGWHRPFTSHPKVNTIKLSYKFLQEQVLFRTCLISFISF